MTLQFEGKKRSKALLGAKGLQGQGRICGRLGSEKGLAGVDHSDSARELESFAKSVLLSQRYFKKFFQITV